MWGESGAGRSPQCGAERAQPMGSADGGARAGGGSGAGRYFRGGSCVRQARGRAEQSCEVPARSWLAGRQAGRRAQGGARAAGEARGRRAAALVLGPGLRDPETAAAPAAAAAARGAEWTPPCPRSASGHPCSPGTPRGLASVKVSGGWRLPRGGGPTRGVLPRGPEQCWPRRDAPGASPAQGCATLCPPDPGAPGCRGEASRPPPPRDFSAGSEALAVWAEGEPRSGLGRDAVRPASPPSGASFLQRGRPVTTALL